MSYVPGCIIQYHKAGLIKSNLKSFFSSPLVRVFKMYLFKYWCKVKPVYNLVLCNKGDTLWVSIFKKLTYILCTYAHMCNPYNLFEFTVYSYIQTLGWIL